MMLKQQLAAFWEEYRGPFHSLNDSIRILTMVALATVLFWPDTTMFKIVQYALGIQVTLSLISHLTRKLLFPRVDLDALFTKAKEEPLSASLALFSIAIVLAVLILVSARMFGAAPQ